MSGVDVVVCDPPWRFRDSLPGRGRGAAKYYQCLSAVHLCGRVGFDFPPIGPDAVLFLWVVEAMQQEALSVAAAWGFTAKTSGIWIKTTATGKAHFGMGRYLRASHERFMVCTRGKAPVANKAARSVFVAPTGVHSAKPDAFYELVETLYPLGGGRRHFEMFSRKTRPGWIQYGDEAGKLDLVG